MPHALDAQCPVRGDRDAGRDDGCPPLLEGCSIFVRGTTSEPKIPLSERILRSWSAVRGPLVGTLLLAAAVLYAALLSPTYAIGDWLTWPTLLLWGYNILLFTGFCATGQWLIRSVLRLPLPVLETFALSIPVGMVVFVVLMHGFGAVGLFKTWAMVALALAPGIATAERHQAHLFWMRPAAREPQGVPSAIPGHRPGGAG